MKKKKASMVLTVRRQRRNKNIINNWQYVSGFDVSFESLYFCKRKNLKNKRRGTSKSNFAVNFFLPWCLFIFDQFLGKIWKDMWSLQSHQIEKSGE